MPRRVCRQPVCRREVDPIEDMLVHPHDSSVAEDLLQAQPDANVNPDPAADFLRRAIEGSDAIRPHLDEVALQRGEEWLAAHPRVRLASRTKDVRHRVEPQLPPDVLGIYVYLPKG